MLQRDLFTLLLKISTKQVKDFRPPAVVKKFFILKKLQHRWDWFNHSHTACLSSYFAKLFSFLFHLARPFCHENTISSIRVASFYSADLGMIRNSVQTFSKRSDWVEHFWSALNYSSIIFVNTWNHWLVMQRSVFSHWWPVIVMTQQSSRESFIQLKFPWVIQSL